jgi:hypothetical protein
VGRSDTRAHFSRGRDASRPPTHRSDNDGATQHQDGGPQAAIAVAYLAGFRIGELPCDNQGSQHGRRPRVASQ